MAKTWKVHKAAGLFPRIGGDELKELKADIEANGIRVPVLVNKAKDTILDGRNRMMIAHDLGLKEDDVPFEIFKGKDETGEIISRNIHRRHLTDDQRVALITKLRGPGLAKQAAERQKAGKADPSLKSDEGRVDDQIAREAKVTRHKARTALDAAKHVPKDLDRVIEGKERLAAAHARARARAGKNRKPKPEKTFRQIVEAKFLRFRTSFPPSRAREMIAIVRELVEDL
jgi:ParB-like nuclease domain.